MILYAEPKALDPIRIAATESNHVFHNLHRGLFSFDDKKGLIPEGALKCRRPNPKTLRCRLNSKFKWSDGTPVLAQDYVNAYQRLLGPSSKSRDMDLLFSLKNAREIVKGALPATQLGVSAPQPSELLFEFATPDYEFEYKLVSPVLVPWKSENLYSGPYKVEKWEEGRRALLLPNEFYPRGNPNRPRVEVLFLEAEATALTLYETNRADFVPRLPIVLARRFLGKPELRKIPFSRFDYIGFNPTLAANETLRRALVLGSDYAELQKALESEGRLGCPSLQASYVDKERCYNFDFKRALELMKNTKPLSKSLAFGYSQAGGDDVQRTAEWFQAQWKKLGVPVELRPIEQRVYLQELRTSPPEVFRKGVPLTRPTCLAALETFVSVSEENYIRFQNPRYDKILEEIQQHPSARQRKVLCGKALQILMDEAIMIPLGRMAFYTLLRPSYSGVEFNSINQIDMSGLRQSPK